MLHRDRGSVLSKLASQYLAFVICFFARRKQVLAAGVAFVIAFFFPATSLFAADDLLDELEESILDIKAFDQIWSITLDKPWHIFGEMLAGFGNEVAKAL